MTEPIQEVLRDHFEECFKHFGKWFNSKSPRGRRGRHETMKPLADFCGVSDQTVQHWLDDTGRSPKGESYFKFMCYLDLHGYKVIEFERMPKVLRNFAELIGYSILSPEEAFRLVGYNDAYQIYAVLNEKDGISREKETKMWNIWKEKREELEQKKRQAFKSSRLEILFKPASSLKVIPGQQTLALLESIPNEFAKRRSATLHIMRGLLELLNEGLFENISEQEVANFDNADKLRIAQLSVHFSTLSSKLIRI